MQQMIIIKILLKQTNCLRIFLFQIALDLKKKTIFLPTNNFYRPLFYPTFFQGIRW